MFLRRDRRSVHRLVFWQVGLFFLAAGVWLGGVVAENRVATGAAIVIALAAIVLGMVGRRGAREE